MNCKMCESYVKIKDSEWRHSMSSINRSWEQGWTKDPVMSVAEQLGFLDWKYSIYDWLVELFI